MATATKRATLHVPANNNMQLPAVPPWDVPAPEELEEESDVDRVASMMRSGSSVSRAVVKIYKIDATGGSVFCEEYSPAEFEQGGYSMLRAAFGAGEFKVMLYGDNPDSGRFGILAREKVRIAENRGPTKTIESNSSDNGLTQVLKSIAENQALMLNALVDIKKEPARDPMQEMTKMFSMMGLMREAMGLTNTNQKSSIGEIVEAMRELRGVASELTPGGDSEPSLTSMIPSMLELIKNGMQQQQQPAQSQMPMVAIPESINTKTTVTPAPLIPQKDDDMFALVAIVLKGHLKALIEMAEKKEEPQNGATLIYEKIPDEMIDIMELPGWFDELAKFSPDVIPHKEWITLARDLAMVMFATPDSDDVDKSPA